MKIKIPKLPRIRLRKRKKLRATTARKPLRIAATADYEEMAEPNMKLSRALLIVLVLHVVAVSGIIAFNAIKTRQTAAPVSSASTPRPTPAVAPAIKTNNSSPQPVTAQKESSRPEQAKPARSPVKPVAKEDRKAEPSKPVEPTAAPDAGKVYVVAKGDNPVTIAKKLNVSYDDLIALNHIDDPRKLQIGQKLLIPKAPKAKKAGE
jgi:LysM repeat protein